MPSFYIAMYTRTASLLLLCALFAGAAAAASYPLTTQTRENMPPRKVIVGTTVQGFWGEYPGLEKRLEQLRGLVDEIGRGSVEKYGRHPDLVVLPENAVTNGASDRAANR